MHTSHAAWAAAVTRTFKRILKLLVSGVEAMRCLTTHKGIAGTVGVHQLLLGQGDDGVLRNLHTQKGAIRFLL